MTRLPSDGDRESGVGWNLKGRPLSVMEGLFRAIQNDRRGSLDHFHLLGLLGSEVVGAGQNDADGLSLPIGHDDSVRDNPTLKVDIGLGVNGDIVEFHAIPHRFRETSLQGQKNPDLGIFGFRRATFWHVVILLHGRRSHSFLCIQKGGSWDRANYSNFKADPPRGGLIHLKELPPMSVF